MQHRRHVRSVLFTVLCAAGTIACGEELAVVTIDDAPDFAVRLLPEEGATGSDAGTVPSWESEDDEDSEELIPADQSAQDDEGPLSCNEIFACFAECADGEQACIDDCFSQGNSASQNAVSAIGACVRENGCSDNDCVEANCAAQVRTCDDDEGGALTPPSTPDAPSDPVVPAPSPAEDTLTCNEIFGCFGDCTAGDSDCFDACYNEGSARAQQGVQGISECIRDTGCETQECIQESCAEQIEFCDSDDRPAAQDPVDPAPAPGGDTLSCNEVFACFNECAEGDRACTDRCFERGTPSGQQAVSSIGACIQANGCQEQTCIDQNCQAEIAVCDADSGGPAAPSPAADGLTCNQIYGCFDQCRGDRACVDVCFEQGSALGQRAVQDISQCISVNGCQDEACARFNCADQIAFCDAQDGPDAGNAPGNGAPGDGAPGGALTCVEVFQCSQTCAPGDQLCARDCYDRGTAQGRDEADAVAMCVQNNQCRDDACARASCAPEIQACETPDGGGAQPNLPDNMGEDGPDEPVLFGRDPLAGDGTCDAPNPLRFGQVRGSTVDAPEALRGECAGGGAEKVFSFTVDAATPVCIDTDGSDFDTVLYVRADACVDAQAEVACNDDELGIQSQVGMMANPGVTYYVAVDGYNRSGEFVLNMSEGNCL